MKTLFTTLISLLLYFISQVRSHGYMLEPPNRSSIWRLQEFKVYNATVNNNDNQNYCGGFQVQYDVNRGLCGVCGDPYNQSHPRDNEDGGKYNDGITVRRYKAGQVIPIHVNITQNHWGYFELRLCANNDIESHLDQSCYDEHILELVGYRRPFITARWYKTKPKNISTSYTSKNRRPTMPERDDSNTKFYIDSDHHRVFYRYYVKLPENVKCKYCVLQWHWRTANNYGYCYGNTYKRGCGPQENFRGCADISIY